MHILMRGGDEIDDSSFLLQDLSEPLTSLDHISFTDGTGPMGQAAARIASFCEALPELGSDVMGILMSSNPAMVATPPEEVRPCQIPL